LPALAKQFPEIKRLPVSIRIVLESVLRNCDGNKITEEHVAQLARWQPKAERVDEIPFVVARVVLQDFTGVPCWPTWPPCATWLPSWARSPSPSSRWCRWTWWWTTPSWSTTSAPRRRWT
jgi:hypothetical protein